MDRWNGYVEWRPTGVEASHYRFGSTQQVARLDFWPHHPGHVVTDWKVLVSQDGHTFTEVFSSTQPQCRTAAMQLQAD